MAQMRRCIGSAKYGIEGHEAAVDDFPKQPSQKDGLGRMCRPHWNQYTAGLARDRKARQAAEDREEGHPDRPSAAAVPDRVKAKAAAKRAKVVETPAVTERRRKFSERLEKVGPGSEAGQRMLEQAAKARGKRVGEAPTTAEEVVDTIQSILA